MVCNSISYIKTSALERIIPSHKYAARKPSVEDALLLMYLFPFDCVRDAINIQRDLCRVLLKSAGLPHRLNGLPGLQAYL
jgi:hypothetical protein